CSTTRRNPAGAAGAPCSCVAAAPRSARSTSAAGRSRAGRRLRRGQPHGEGAAGAGGRVDSDMAALQLGQEARDRQSEPGAPEIATARLIDAEKAVEDPLDMLRGDARPRV